MDYEPLLSLCIPVFNREEYIASTLDSILAQINPGIEVVVVDNCSTDATFEIVQQISKKYQCVKAFRNDENLGADLNYLEVIERAKGKYCWFLGSDDHIEHGAIEVVVKNLETEPDVIMVDHWVCTIDLQKLYVNHLLKNQSTHTFDTSDRRQFLEYLLQARNQSSIFGYLSSIVVKRDAWNSVPTRQEFMGTLYVHTAKLFDLAQRGIVIEYLDTPLVLWRGGNDSFGGSGRIFNRFFVDFDGFALILEKIFQEDRRVQSLIKAVFRRHHHLKNLAYLRKNTSSKSKWDHVIDVASKKFGYHPLPLYMMRPTFVRTMLEIAYELYKPSRKLFRKFRRWL